MKSDEILTLLPSIYRRGAREGSILRALVETMSDLHGPAEAVLSEVERYFDARRTPEPFVPYLARWVDVARFLSSERDMERGAEGSIPVGTGQLREWIAGAAELSRWRGTRRGMLMLLEAATGIRGFEIDEAVPGPDGQPRPFHFRLAAPEEAREQAALIERILELEKPAYMTYDPVRYGETNLEKE